MLANNGWYIQSMIEYGQITLATCGTISMNALEYMLLYKLEYLKTKNLEIE